MKVKILKNSLVLLTLLLMYSSGIAQQGRGNCSPSKADGCCKNLLNLTEDQEEKIDALRIKHLKEMSTFKNQLAVKKAELRVLETADKPDKTAIDKKIDEIMQIKTQMAKKSASHKQDVRMLLTEEQRVIFDMQKGKGKTPDNCRQNCPHEKQHYETRPGGPPHQPRQ